MINNKHLLYTIIFGKDGSNLSDSELVKKIEKNILKVINILNKEDLDVAFFSDVVFNSYRVQLRNFDHVKYINKINIISTGEDSYVEPLSKAVETWFSLFTNKTLGDFIK